MEFKAPSNCSISFFWDPSCCRVPFGTSSLVHRQWERHTQRDRETEPTPAPSEGVLTRLPCTNKRDLWATQQCETVALQLQTPRAEEVVDLQNIKIRRFPPSPRREFQTQQNKSCSRGPRYKFSGWRPSSWSSSTTRSSRNSGTLWTERQKGNASKNSSFFKIPSCCPKIWRRRRRRRALRENAIQQHLLTKLEPAQFLCRLVTSSRAESPEHYVPTDDSSQSGNEVSPELNICWTAPSESSKATELSNKMGWYHTAELESLARLKASSSSSPTKNKIKILLTTTPAKLS